MAQDIPKQYEPADWETQVSKAWLEQKIGAATPDERAERYVIMMPLPNVTGALHMGHAMDNVMQDMLIRWHRMRGDNTLWMAGTDHAGIATQAVVEKRLYELEGKTRKDVGREALVERIWEWKEQYQKRIVSQLQRMGCSCDWDRERFTMDAVCARAVRYTFFKMFTDGLIYRGDRLVNWDCHLQTAVADDEIAHETVDGHFWHLRYPIIDPAAGEPDAVVVATTRPETMLGDTAVACHPDPERQLKQVVSETESRLARAAERDRERIEQELERYRARLESHLPQLIRLRDMAQRGTKILLPLLNREIPLILDEWAKPELGSGCVKITPAHDPNDYEVWTRHKREIAIINILNVDGTLNDNAGPYATLDRFEARRRVVKDLEQASLLDRVEERRIEVGHSDRSKTPVEPYISKQWFVAMGDRPDGIVCGRDTPKEFKSPGLAQAAIDAANGEWKSPTGRTLSFHPDERYTRTYLNWLAEKRDWCISRQLWWGHQIPIWSRRVTGTDIASLRSEWRTEAERADVSFRVSLDDGTHFDLFDASVETEIRPEDAIAAQVCFLDLPTDDELAAKFEAQGYVRDPDVLDTWFSSGIWPHSTLGWPDPETAEISPGQAALKDQGHGSALDYYYPGSCLVTGRDIITLWIARMVLTGLYNLGDLPFTDCFIHANILDGKGERMSKSKGNGIDPVDIVDRYGTDAMRYVLCELQTGSQDIKLPVQADSPYTGNPIDLAQAKHGSTIFTYLCPETGKEFDVLGSMEGVPAAKPYSERFDVGRSFCNKLWNACRFALTKLGKVEWRPVDLEELGSEERWILSRLEGVRAEVHAQLEGYNPAAAIGSARDFFWNDLCDWYLEMVKPRIGGPESDQNATQVVALALDHVLRLLHPFIPFITEALWSLLKEVAPNRGLASELTGCDCLLAQAPWPEAQPNCKSESTEAAFEVAQSIVRGLRDLRAQYDVKPSQALDVSIKPTRLATPAALAATEDYQASIANLANLKTLTRDDEATPSKTAATLVTEGLELFVHDVIDLDKEKTRLTKELAGLEKRINGSRAKLSNENFVNRAQPEVVERERQNLSHLEGELKTLTETLKALDE